MGGQVSFSVSGFPYTRQTLQYVSQCALFCARSEYQRQAYELHPFTKAMVYWCFLVYIPIGYSSEDRCSLFNSVLKVCNLCVTEHHSPVSVTCPTTVVGWTPSTYYKVK